MRIPEKDFPDMTMMTMMTMMTEIVFSQSVFSEGVLSKLYFSKVYLASQDALEVMSVTDSLSEWTFSLT